ncbi:MAG TPA: thioredoxin domain-containing protein [Candidatus Saccharimonadales bacterium]|nr:thioredoxin domain-containing protein [Candidatus Saccharimonadales bacterium]
MAILAVIIIIFVGFAAFSNHSKGTSSNTSGAQPTSHIEGQGKSGVKLVEYGDYQCPVCEAYYQPVKQAVSQLNSQIYFQFRNLPLVSIHPNAFAGARAAEAAGLQGKYWQMHDLLYDNQSSWAESSNPQSMFDGYAQQLKLNLNQFKQDYASSKVNDAINADLNAFSKTNQEEATPTFFLDGKYINNSQFSDPQTGLPQASKIVAVVQAEIAKKTSAAKSH